MKALDLFCGAAGGWSLGLSRADVQIVAACEIDPWRRGIYAASHPGVPIYVDVRELTAARLLADLGCLPDIVVGSPPCQEISAANSKGTGITDDHLFWEWARLVFEVRPRWCAAENSPRARTQGIDGILDALDQAGYAAWPLVVGAKDIGANHLRGRVWILAADATRGNFAAGPAVAGAAGQRGEESGRADGATGADAERLELRQQSRGCGGKNGAGAAVAGGDARDADEIHAASQRPIGGVREGAHAGPGRTSGHAEDNARLGHRRMVGRRGAEPAEARLPDAADAARSRHEIRSRRRRDHGAQLPPALRDIGLAWPHWNGGLAGLAASCAAAGFGGMDDGLPVGLPAGLRNRAIAAYGDAVLPQITEAIARVMLEIVDGLP